MGVYISGVDLPTDKVKSLIICPSGKVYTDYIEVAGQAINVPPHGRLIGADAFLQLCVDYAITPGDMEFCKRLEYALTKAPTIIPDDPAEEHTMEEFMDGAWGNPEGGSL